MHQPSSTVVVGSTPNDHLSNIGVEQTPDVTSTFDEDPATPSLYRYFDYTPRLPNARAR